MVAAEVGWCDPPSRGGAVAQGGPTHPSALPFRPHFVAGSHLEPEHGVLIQLLRRKGQPLNETNSPRAVFWKNWEQGPKADRGFGERDAEAALLARGVLLHVDAQPPLAADVAELHQVPVVDVHRPVGACGTSRSTNGLHTTPVR